MIENYQKIFQVPQEAFDKIVAKSFEYQYPVLIRERVERVKTKQSSSEKELFRSYLNDRIEENLKVCDFIVKMIFKIFFKLNFSRN
jgi:hypothetical protein